MKKRTKKILALVLALVLIAGLGVFANALVGNPFSKWLATRTTEKILEEKYADTDFYIERVTYSFKDGGYHAFIKSHSSVDSEFSIRLNMDGSMSWDSYEDRVLSGENTASRINKDYRAATDAIFTSPSFPYETHIEFGDLEFISEELKDVEDVPKYALILEDLELDQVYNIQELGRIAGHLVLYVYDEEVSAEKAAEILLEVKRQMDAGGVAFYAIDLVLEYPKTEDDSPRPEGRVEVIEFLYDDIYEEGLAERVRKANEAADAYYARKDVEKNEQSAVAPEKCLSESAGVITFYAEPVKEAQNSDEPVTVMGSVELNEGQADKLQEIIEQTEAWVDDRSVDRLAYYFDGDFELSDSEFVYYFTYEHQVIYYDHYFAEISAEDMQYIKDIGKVLE